MLMHLWFSQAVTLYEIGKDLPKATEIMSTVTDLMQRIAGKSIPLEVSAFQFSWIRTSVSNTLGWPEIRCEESAEIYPARESLDTSWTRAHLCLQLHRTCTSVRPTGCTLGSSFCRLGRIAQGRGPNCLWKQRWRILGWRVFPHFTQITLTNATFG